MLFGSASGSEFLQKDDTKVTVSDPDSAISLFRRPDQLYAGYMFDLDGTLYLGSDPLPGALQLIARLRKLGSQILFLTNNPTRDPETYATKLTAMGIPATPDEIVNTVFTTVQWLSQYHPDATVYPISEQPLIDALATAGIRMSNDPSQIDFVIASYDRTFTYEKLQIAFDAIWFHQRAQLITTNPDRYCPFPGGRGEPDAATIVAAIEAGTGTKCIQNLGKPDPYMLEAALSRIGLTASDCVMTGDRLQTDIRMAIDAGMSSALVFTGEATPETLTAAPPDAQPTYVLDRVDHLLPG